MVSKTKFEPGNRFVNNAASSRGLAKLVIKAGNFRLNSIEFEWKFVFWIKKSLRILWKSLRIFVKKRKIPKWLIPTEDGVRVSDSRESASENSLWLAWKNGQI